MSEETIEIEQIRPPDLDEFPGRKYWADSLAWDAYQSARSLREREAANTVHLIEVAFVDIDERDRAFDAIEKLLGEMGQIGTLSARTECTDAK